MSDSLLLAYVALGVGAVVPIYAGSMNSLRALERREKRKLGGKKSAKEGDDSESEEEETESLSSEDAMWFPIVGSGVLFGLYMLFRFFSREHVNLLLTAYFAMLGTAAMTKTISALLKLLGAARLPHNQAFRLRLNKRPSDAKVFSLRFDYVDVAAAALAVVFTAYYVLTKNWIASNVYGEAFATSAVQLLDLDDFKTGMMLLSGLFFYDIFWVFGTDVMVTVAKNFDAPIKLLFPKNVFAEKLEFTMLGLGDIVIPGIFVALCLRFDYHLAKNKKSFGKPYFTACLIAYILGLATTVFIMHTFKAAQPALLYLSPACILSVLLTAVVRGELKQVFEYKSVAAKEKDGKEKKKK